MTISNNEGKTYFEAVNFWCYFQNINCISHHGDGVHFNVKETR